MVSSEPQNVWLSNLVWSCSIISQSVIQKNWFTVFDVKVTASAYTIKIWLFLLYVLNCWSVWTKLGLIVQHYKLAVLWKNRMTAFKVKVTAKVQNVSECLSGWYLLNRRSCWCQTWYGNAASWARVWYRKKWLAAFNVKVTMRAYIIKIWLFLLYLLNCWLALM